MPTDDSALGWSFSRVYRTEVLLDCSLNRQFPKRALEEKVHRVRGHHYEGVGDQSFSDKLGVSTNNLAVKCDAEKPNIDIQTKI
jgi:hypothetical protein